MSRKYKDYPGYMRTSKSAGQSGWSVRSIVDAHEQGLLKDSFRDPETDVLYVSDQDVDDLKWLIDHHKKNLRNLRNIDEMRAQYDAISFDPQPTIAPLITQPQRLKQQTITIGNSFLDKCHQYRLWDDPSKTFDLIEAYEKAMNSMSYLLRTLQELLDIRPEVA